jgi:hypothetical protein
VISRPTRRVGCSIDDEMNDQLRIRCACLLPTYTRYTGTTRCYMRGKAEKYVMAPLAKPFDCPIGSWVTWSTCIPEAGGLVRRPNPRWKIRLGVWRLDCWRRRSANRSCALERRGRRLVWSGFTLGVLGVDGFEGELSPLWRAMKKTIYLLVRRKLRSR